MKNNKKKIIVLTPVYNEEDSLHRYIEVVSDVLFQNKDYNFSILFIDDGSVDSSWELICEFSRKEPLLFQGIRLSRNFGSHTAIAAGLEQIENYDAVVILACDLQDPPETILFFLKKWEQGASIVWGKRQSRDDSPWRIVTGQIFSWLMRRFAMPKDSKFTTGSFFLIDKKVAFALISLMGVTITFFTCCMDWFRILSYMTDSVNRVPLVGLLAKCLKQCMMLY